mgnify:CR=1 FL=1
MNKGYFSKEAKCERKNFAPCAVNKEALLKFLQAKAEEVLAFAKEVLGESYPAHFVMPKILLLPVHKKQSFGKYAYNMVLQEEEKLAQACGAEKKALQEKLAVMKGNIKIEQPVKGSFFADGGIVIYYCNVCQLCEKHGLNFEDYITSVLVHEIFHTLHFACCDKTQEWQQMKYWNGTGYEYAKVSAVRESLAEYFRYLWLVKNQQELLLAKMKQDLTEPHATVPNYPYAGVKYLLSEEVLKNAKFHSVLESSLVNWQEAYDLLIS